MRKLLLIILLLVVFGLLTPPVSSQTSLNNWHEKNLELYEGTRYHIGDYIFEYFSFKNGKVKCLNVLDSDYQIIHQYCNNKIEKNDLIGETLGEIKYLNDSSAFLISGSFDDRIDINFYSNEEVELKKYSSKWFSSHIQLTSQTPESTLSISPKDTFSVSLNFKNIGEKESGTTVINRNEYHLYAILPKGWKATFKTSDRRISSFDAGVSEEISITTEIESRPEDFEEYVISLVVFNNKSYRPEIARYDLRIVRRKEDLTTELTTSTPIIIAKAGDSLDAQLTLKNKGSLAKTYALSSFSPSGWNVTFKESGFKVPIIEVEGGSSASLTASIEVPKTASDKTYLLGFLAENDVTKAELNTTIIIDSGDDSSKLTATLEEIIISQDDEIELSFNLENKKVIERTYLLNATLPEKWNVTFKQSNIGVPKVKVEGESTVSYTAKLSVPDDAQEGYYSLFFSANSNDSNTITQVMVRIKTKEDKSKFYTSTPTIITSPGKELKISLQLEGEKDKSYSLKSDSPPDWEVNYYLSGFKVPSVITSSTVNLDASVYIPDETPIGYYTLTFIAEREDERKLILPVKIEVEGTYNLVLELSRLYTLINAGETKELRARISNLGKNTVTGVELKLEIPDGWQYNITPRKVPKLKPDDASDFSVLINPPAWTDVGDYFLKIRAISEQTKSKESSLRVSIKQENSTGRIGLYIALGALLFLLLIYTLFGRR